MDHDERGAAGHGDTSGVIEHAHPYVLTDEWHVEPAPGRGETPPLIDLDPRFYKLLRDFEDRFPAGPPSLVACEQLTVVGDVTFGSEVVVRGSVRIGHKGDGGLRIEDGAVLEG